MENNIININNEKIGKIEEEKEKEKNQNLISSSEEEKLLILWLRQMQGPPHLNIDM